MEDKIFDLEEVSRYLNLSKSTLYKLSQRKKIPSIKIGKQLRFRKSSLDKWLAKKESGYSSVNYNSAKEKTETARCILLVDDDSLVLKTLGRFLENQGYKVESAINGEEALAKAEKSGFDLVIADVRMPGINGIETIRRLRGINHQRRRPTTAEIVITGYMDTQAQQEAVELGVTDYIHKPFVISEFMEIVNNKLGSGLN